MSNFEPTIPPASERTTTLGERDMPLIPPVDDVSASRPTAAAGDGPRVDNPLADVKPEPPRSHPIAYAALAVALLALLLSLLAMRDGGDDFREVKVGNADCVIGPAEGADVLYCRTGAAPPT